MPFCIGSTLLLLAGALECYFATNFKKLDDELPHYIKKSWFIAAIFTLIGAFFGILDTCLLLGIEARIDATGPDTEFFVAEHKEKEKLLINNQ